MRVVAILMAYTFFFIGCSERQEVSKEQIRKAPIVSNGEVAFEDTVGKDTIDTIQPLKEVGVSPDPETLNPAELAQELSLGNVGAWKLIRRYYMNDDSSYVEPLYITASMNSAPEFIRNEAAKMLRDHNSSFSDSILKILPCDEGYPPPRVELDTSLRRQPFYTAGIDNINLGFANGIDQLYYRSPVFNSEFSELLCSGRPANFVLPDDMIPLALTFTNLDSLDGFYLLGDTLPATKIPISSITYDQDYSFKRLIAKSRRMQELSYYQQSLACYSPDAAPTYIVRNNPTIDLPHPVQLHIESMRTESTSALELEAKHYSIPPDSILLKYPDFFSSSAYRFTVVDNGGNSQTRYLLIAKWGVKSLNSKSYIVDEEGRRVAHVLSRYIVSLSHIVHDTSGKESDYLFLKYYRERESVALVIQFDGNDHYKSIYREVRYYYD